MRNRFLAALRVIGLGARRLRGGHLRGAAALGALGVVLCACAPDPLPGEPQGASAEAGRGQSGEDATLALPVLDIGGAIVTVDDLERMIGALPQSARERFSSPQERLRFVEFFVWSEVIARDAVERGWLNGSSGAFLPQDALARYVLERPSTVGLSGAELSEERVRERYEALREALIRPPRRKVRAIVAPTREVADEVVARFDEGVAEGSEAARDVFAWLARWHSTDEETRVIGGEQGWWVRAEHGGTLPASIEELVFSAEEDTIAGTVETERGFEVIFIETVQSGYAPSFDDVRNYIMEREASAQRAQGQREALDAWREGAQLDAAAVAALSGARVGGDARVRPRRYSVEALAEGEGLILGDATAAIVDANDATFRREPRAALRVLASRDGSGDGSGAQAVEAP